MNATNKISIILNKCLFTKNRGYDYTRLYDSHRIRRINKCNSKISARHGQRVNRAPDPQELSIFLGPQDLLILMFADYEHQKNLHYISDDHLLGGSVKKGLLQSDYDNRGEKCREEGQQDAFVL